MESLVRTENDGRNLSCVELDVFDIRNLTWVGQNANTHIRALDQLLALTSLRRLSVGTFAPSSMAQTDVAHSWVDQDMQWMVNTWPCLTEFTIDRCRPKFKPTIPPRRRKSQVAA
ncbi:hypothetical protein BGZ83_002768 [Gryganskiella cystojenkinii]|nr:hypothetical protein BGZ83_002768 [Gryganskiella cystojenkinii]